MRRKTKRDLIAFIGVIVLISGVFLFNSNVDRLALATKMDELRREAESSQRKSGIDVMRWDLIRKTTGNLRSGAVFDNELMEYDGQKINIVGFMVPDKKFRDVSEFVLLPLPIECYFCQRPPLRDVIYVQMKEGLTTTIYEDPVVINGEFHLAKGENIQSFYHITSASLGPGEVGGMLKRKAIDAEHMLPDHVQDVQLEEGIEPPVPLDY